MEKHSGDTLLAQLRAMYPDARETVIARYAGVFRDNGVHDVGQVKGMSLDRMLAWPGFGNKMAQVALELGAVDDRPVKEKRVLEPRKCAKCGEPLQGKQYHRVTVTVLGLPRERPWGTVYNDGSKQAYGKALCRSCAQDVIGELQALLGA